MTITTQRKGYPQSDFSRGPESAIFNSENIVTAASLLGGTALAAYGITRRDWKGAALAMGGIALAYCGIKKPYRGKVRVSCTIGMPPDDVYAFVREPRNWPHFLHGLEMESNDDGSLKLTFGEPAGFKVISEANITAEETGQFIAWGSGQGPLLHRGVIRFRAAPGERGTEISVAFEFKIPAGPVARAVAAFVGWDPEQLVRESLRHLKELLEAGEIPTASNQSVGARGFKGSALRVLYRETPEADSTKARMAGD